MQWPVRFRRLGVRKDSPGISLFGAICVTRRPPGPLFTKFILPGRSIIVNHLQQLLRRAGWFAELRGEYWQEENKKKEMP